jgi:hypothetical protein
MRSHPNKAVDVAFHQTSEKQTGFEQPTDLRVGGHPNALRNHLRCSGLGCARS